MNHFKWLRVVSWIAGLDLISVNLVAMPLLNAPVCNLPKGSIRCNHEHIYAFIKPKWLLERWLTLEYYCRIDETEIIYYQYSDTVLFCRTGRHSRSPIVAGWFILYMNMHLHFCGSDIEAFQRFLINNDDLLAKRADEADEKEETRGSQTSAAL